MTSSDDPAGWPGLVGLLLGLGPGPLARLRGFLGAVLAVRSCTGTLRELRRWVRAEHVPWDPLLRGLRALGARCDCEVLEVLSRE